MNAIKAPSKHKHKNAGVKMALQIIEEGKRPMSPSQIQRKYELSLPFTVKRVVAYAGSACPCSPPHKEGQVYTFTEISEDLYIYAHCRCGKFNKLGILHDSERFVWIGEPI